MNRPDVQRAILIGREAEIELGLRLLSATRLLTLTGPGGTGKTRLALAIAEQSAPDFPDGVIVVSLAPVTDPDLVCPTIAGALGVTVAGDRPVIESVQRHLADKRLLLVLDNFEQVMDAAPVAGAIIDACAGVDLLVTSRARLQLSSEQVMPVPPLSVPDPAGGGDVESLARNAAVRLFVARVQTINPAFSLTDANAGAVADICRRLDGLPLAIELAASRARLLTPQAISQRLDDALPLLTGGPRDAPARQQTVRDTISWSYDLLRPDEQRLFRQLAVFAGGWTLESAQAVCDGDLDVLEVLAALVDHSLVRRFEQPDGSARFGMLETIRAYGLEMLESSGDAAGAYDRLVSYLLHHLADIEPTAMREPEASAYQRADAEIDTLRAALSWTIVHDPESALRLAMMVWQFWWARGYLSEGRGWLKAALAAAPESVPPADRGHALSGASMMASDQGDHDEAARLAAESLPYLEAAGDRRGITWGMRRKGWTAFITGDYVTARELHLASLALARELREPATAGPILGNMAAIAHAEGDLDQAVALAEEAVAVLRRSLESGGHGGGLAIQLAVYASVLVQRHDYSRAGDTLRECVNIAMRIGAPTMVVTCLAGFAAVATGEGRLEQAARLYGARDALRQTIGEVQNWATDPIASRDIARIRESLGDEAWTACWQQGRSMSLDAATAYALDPPVEAARSSAASAANPGNLTARELDVLRLVAQGMSDAEVAEHLFIARRTVNTHLTSIFNKLGVSSRTAAATWAVRHGVSDERA